MLTIEKFLDSDGRVLRRELFDHSYLQRNKSGTDYRRLPQPE